MKIFLLILILVIYYLNRVKSEKYFFSYPIKKNWFEAMEICKIKRMELVAVDSENKQKEIQNYIESFNYKENFNSWPEGIWTSGNDLGNEGKFIWMTTGEHISEDQLKKPGTNLNNHLHDGCNDEDCITMTKFPANDFIFNDDSCIENRYFICEKIYNSLGLMVYERYCD